MQALRTGRSCLTASDGGLYNRDIWSAGLSPTGPECSRDARWALLCVHMSLLVVNNIEKSFGADTILEGVGFRLEWGQKLGLVGRNGAGKTTLLRILTGQMEADKGTVNFLKGVRFGYLRQEQMVEHGWTVYQEAQDAFGPVLEMERRLRDLECQMGEVHGAALDSVLEEYGLMHDRFQAMG